MTHRPFHPAVLAAVVVLAAPRLAAQSAGADWPNLRRYRQANTELAAPLPDERRVVFMGNSITEAWAPYFAAMFPGKP